MELLYTKEKDYLMDAQLETTECEKCGVDIDPMKSYITKNKKGINGFIFVCASCKTKSIMKLRKELL